MPRHLLYPFLPYRSLVLPILVLSAIVVPCWLAFRVYRARSAASSLSWRREALLLIVVAYLSGLAAVTLVPNHPSREVAHSTPGIALRPSGASLTCSGATLPEGSRARGFCVRNARGNVLLFIPLGFLLPLVWTGVRLRRALSIAIAVSVGIEVLQYFSRALGSQRTADVNDVLLNAFGACIGLALVSLLRLVQGRRPAVVRA